MEDINIDATYEWGILIHQLPKQLMGKALRVLPRDIKHTYINASGMRVYFKRKNTCDDFIRKKSINLDGILFNVYSTVTCLTAFGIHGIVSEQAIETYLRAKGMCKLNLYSIFDTNHYRIILDVPEVLANIELDPISLDSNLGTGFAIDFYCRVCCDEGHKQYQCQKFVTKNHGADDAGNISGKASSSNARTLNQEKDAMASVSVVPGTPRRRLERSVKKTQRGSKQEYPCKEIVKIIMKVRGILSPHQLCQFLEDVHCKKKVIDYALKFTQDIPGLIKQIRNVISLYNSRSGSSIANRDIKMLEDLCKRLDLQFKNSK